MNQDKKTEKLMICARISMLRKEPFWGSLAMRLVLCEDPSLNPPTLATDGVTLWYHPEWVQQNSDAYRKSGVAHEIGHCIFQHMARLGQRSPKRWNVAGDYVINAMLKESGFQFPDTWLYDSQYGGMTTDKVYALLEDQSGNEPFDAMREPPPPEPDEIDQAQEWAMATIQAANAARKQGKLPGSIQRFIDDFLDSRADWATLLKRFITERTREGYSWARFNRRYSAVGIYLPGLYSERMETLVVVTDDSGSITDKVLSAFSSEVSAARDAATPMRTIVISCDARVNHVSDLEPGDLFEVKNHGGGGTDFRPPFQWLEERGITPSCLVYLTDLEGSFPAHAPDYPVLWCSINSRIAPWGETISITL